MASSSSGPLGGLSKLWQRVGRRLGFAREADPEPGTHDWVAEVHWDVEQAKRNAGDQEYVQVRREGRVRRARDGETRWAEQLALAMIDARTGMAGEALARATRVVEQNILPDFSDPFFSNFIGWVAKAQSADDGRRLLGAALALADTRERPKIALPLLMEIAGFEAIRSDLGAEQAAVREGLLRLGWGTSADPYRAGSDLGAKLQDWQRPVALWLGSRALIYLCREDSLDNAEALIAELRPLLEGHSSAEKFAAKLLQHEGWIAYRRGDFELARRAWVQLQEKFKEQREPEQPTDAPLLVNIGFALMRVGDLDAAAEYAKATVDAAAGDDDTRARGHALWAEVAWKQGDEDTARTRANAAVEYEFLTARSAANRVLAELALTDGRPDQAVALAQKSVDEGLDALGEDVFLVDRLLTLARAAAGIDGALRDEAIRRALAIPMDVQHPFREDIRRAQEELCR